MTIVYIIIDLIVKLTCRFCFQTITDCVYILMHDNALCASHVLNDPRDKIFMACMGINHVMAVLHGV